MQYRQTPPESRLQASLPPWGTPAQIMFESTCGNAVDHENDDDHHNYEQPLGKGGATKSDEFSEKF